MFYGNKDTSGFSGQPVKGWLILVKETLNPAGQLFNCLSLRT
jgi:hypothetical protein